MSLHSINTGQSVKEVKASQEFAIDKLVAQFDESVDSVIESPEKQVKMFDLLKEYNSEFIPLKFKTWSQKAKILGNVVAGIYAPLIHGFSGTVLKNIENGTLPPVILTPPRDAIPISVSIQTLAKLKGIEVEILMPHINRNTAGIANNQKTGVAKESPLLALHVRQLATGLSNGKMGMVELEPGIYGTTSLVMAERFKQEGLGKYVPIKFYGLGPNLSYVHAVLSGGKEWLAENAEESEQVDVGLISEMMVILDTMEELGMQGFYQSVEELELDNNGTVVPAIVASSQEEQEIAKVTNRAIEFTAAEYQNVPDTQIAAMLQKIPWLVEKSQKGFPFTLSEPIPSMDSKEEHFTKIRDSELFDYLPLTL